MFSVGLIELLIIAVMVLMAAAALWFLIWILRQATKTRQDIHALREDVAALRDSRRPPR